MRNSIAVLIVASTLMVSGCGGGGGKHGSNSSPSGVGSNSGESPQSFNGGLTGKIYFDRSSWYKALDIATGQRQDVYYLDHGHWATQRRDGQEFAVGANETKTGDYFSNEDVVFFDRDGQETDRQMINGEVQGIVKTSPDGRFFAFDWYKDSKKNGLIVLERSGSWERNFGPVNGRGFDWTSDGKLIFAIGNEIYRVDDIATSKPEKIASLPTDTWKYALGLCVSPDDKKIAFWFKSEGDYVGHIFLIGMDGGDLHQVSTSNEWESYVAWSPDGQYLAVVRGDYITNIPDGYWSDAGGLGNTTPRLYVLKADARNVDISADDPADAVAVKEIQEDGSYWYATPDSPIYWYDH